MIRPALLVLLLVGLGAPGSIGADDGPKDPFEPTDRYEVREVEGWSIVVNKRFLAEKPELAGRALDLLRSQLYQVVRRLPEPAVVKLRTIKIWLEEAEPHHPCMAYHPGAGWLRDHGMNPDKARSVEIANARNFLTWCFDQPWMVLHELAHGYHDQFIPDGYRNAEMKSAFDGAMKAGTYQSVLRVGGTEGKSYACTNPMEYFAEGSEAFFGTNDFYPFVRAELKKHDPDLFALLGRLWDAPTNGRPTASKRPEG